MKQEQFEQRYQPLWHRLDQQLDQLETFRLRRSSEELPADLPQLYRQLCNHYALSRARRYSPQLVGFLHRLVLRGHQQLYTRRGAWLWRLLTFIASDFPVSLRLNIGYVWVALALFLLPALLVGGYCMIDDTFIHSLMSDAEISNMEEMYRPDNARPGRTLERSADSDFVMFGFYIYNNIGIGFRTFAMGILAGVGTVFTLFYNGIVIGGVAGYLSGLGYTDTFWPFVCGHSALELTAIVISGAAGLMIGRGVISPGRYSRLDAIKLQAGKAVPLVMGAGLMLLGAAFIEAFWSASSLPNTVKYVAAIILWIMMVLYFMFAGRGADGAR
ncbi:stage II sporulation protein M [Amphritea pacifica]|uniref:Stage II sporulation protein M n=1 Tax=Amphritea pacifica TaxID=2811233 RepID=A0ABS2W4M8_9GAMM|nr:stage II sporulation protein M [Amphritea pacifica]MBN0986671.1 stage II sporulation protein M [Amphritea pacifica]MBN1007263.1 stage II sporulation protein M [Amphritea pacifica]